MLIIGARLQGFAAPGSMGAVRDMTFIDCYWPKLDRPTRLFADGSSGIKVMGRTPRNVWFPDDVEFLTYYPDALYPAEQAVFAAFPFRRSLVNLSPQEATVWKDAYDAAVTSFPPTHSIFETARTVNFLRHYEEKSRRTIVLPQDVRLGDGTIISAGSQIVKVEHEEFIAELTPEEAANLVDGKVSEDALRTTHTFQHISLVDRDGFDVKTPVTLEQWKGRR